MSPTPDERRIPPVDLEQLTAEQREVADRIAGTRGRVPGPFITLLHLPHLADRVQALGAHLRYEGTLDRGLAETVILVVTHRWGSRYAYDAHVPHAQRAGIGDEIIASIGADDGFAAMPEPIRVACRYAIELATTGRVDDELQSAAIDALGREGVVELTVLVGYYSLISLTLNALGWD
jgi:4-carboxymuconolactone decarboxylase